VLNEQEAKGREVGRDGPRRRAEMSIKARRGCDVNSYPASSERRLEKGGVQKEEGGIRMNEVYKECKRNDRRCGGEGYAYSSASS